MPYKVAIKNNATGEIRRHAVSGEWDAVAEYDWTEGNHSCDCNRAAKFHTDAEAELPTYSEACGESRYSIVYVELENGEKIDDFLARAD